jgi:hypothetical protein
MSAPLDALAAALRTPPPWLAPYVSISERVLQAASHGSVADALNDTCKDSDCAVRFIDHNSAAANEPYESFIARTLTVPTRENLHDLFNGLMWLTYPHTKRRLNLLQALQIEQLGTSGRRGALRDALTVFDENAALLQAPRVLLDALRARDWDTLFIKRRPDWENARLVIFGHALLEKLMQPRKAITAHVWLVDEVEDSVLAASLNTEQLSSKPFLPLPVLGVPGWCSANESVTFYDDREVFRPARS